MSFHDFKRYGIILRNQEPPLGLGLKGPIPPTLDLLGSADGLVLGFGTGTSPGLERGGDGASWGGLPDYNPSRPIQTML